MKVDTEQIACVFPDVGLRLKELKGSGPIYSTDADFRARIKSDAFYLETALLEFRHIYNSCSSLLRLPPEVLALIVDLLFVMWPAESAQTADAVTGDLGWIILSHICHQLREALMGRKELWAKSIYVFPDARDMMLARAGDSPASFRLRHSPVGEDDIAFVLRHLVKARAVEIDGFSDCTWTLEPAEFSQKVLPLLEELKLDLFDRKEQLDLLTPDVWDLPPPITPKLRTLYLHSMAVPFNPTTLTNLSLHFNKTPPHLYTTARFSDLLGQCKLLRELELEWATPAYPLQLGDTEQPIELPALERIMVQDAINVCIGLWNHLSVPLSCAAILHLHDIDDHYPDFCSHLEVIPSQLKSSTFEAPIVGLSLWDYDEADEEDAEDVAVCWLMSEPGTVNPTWTGPFKHDYKERLLVYMFSIETTEPHFTKLLSQARNVIDVGQIHTLEIGSRLPYSPKQWSRALASFTSVHTLYLENLPRTPLLLSLAPTVPESQGFATVTLPSLRFLWVEKLDLGDSNDEGASPGPDRVQFIGMLLSRKQKGSPIDHLRIEELRMDTSLAMRSFIPRLRAIVPLVECNTIVSTSAAESPVDS